MLNGVNVPGDKHQLSEVTHFSKAWGNGNGSPWMRGYSEKHDPQPQVGTVPPYVRMLTPTSLAALLSRVHPAQSGYVGLGQEDQ